MKKKKHMTPYLFTIQKELLSDLRNLVYNDDLDETINVSRYIRIAIRDKMKKDIENNEVTINKKQQLND